MSDAPAKRFDRMIKQGQTNAHKVAMALEHLYLNPTRRGHPLRAKGLRRASEAMHYLRINLKLAEQDLNILKRKEARK